MNLFDLTGRKAIVTGAASGLAHGIAEGLMEAGAEVVIIDISANTEAAAKEFCDRGFKAHAVRANLGDRDELNRAFQEALKDLGGKIDILVPAAGVQRRNKSEEFSIEDWDFVL